MAKRGKSARNKGAAAEREFFALLNRFLPERLRIQRELGQSRDGGCDGISAGVAIEVKRQETLCLPKWLKQAREAAASVTSASVGSAPVTPVVVYRRNGEPWRCLVEMTPVQLAAFMRYSHNIGDTVASIERSVGDL